MPDPQDCNGSDSPNYANPESFRFLLTQARNAKTRTPHPMPCCDTGSLTHVTLVWNELSHQDWLKFGKPVASQIIDRSKRSESYRAGQTFGLVCWVANHFGTVHSSLYIVRAVTRDEPVVAVPRVDPGGDLLLKVKGWPKVQQALHLIDAIEAMGIDPCDVAPDYWRHMHNRLAARDTPRGYSHARHRAWLLRRHLTP